jgi:hypothetical protein
MTISQILHFVVQKRKSAYTKPVLACFKSLGDEASAQKNNLLSAMFNVNIDLFLPGGELRAVLEQFALALLRHDAEARKVVGPYNRISGLLERAAGYVPLETNATTATVWNSFSLFQPPTKY